MATGVVIHARPAGRANLHETRLNREQWQGPSTQRESVRRRVEQVLDADDGAIERSERHAST